MTRPRLFTAGFECRRAYGLGDFGLNLYWQSANFFLLFFYTEALGLDPALAGVIFALGGLADALSDPLMGLLADGRGGGARRLRGFMAWGALPLGAAFVAAFLAPMAVEGRAVAPVAAAALILFWLAYTAVSIPYGALAGRLSPDPRERVRLAGARMFFGALGGVAIGLLASALGDLQSGRAFAAIAFIAGGVGASFIVASAFGVRGSTAPDPTSEERRRSAPARSALGAVLTDAPFRILAGGVIALTVANIMMTSTLLYRFDRLLGRPELAGLGVVLTAAIPLVAIPLWTWASLTIGPARASRLGCIAVIAACAVLAACGGSTWATIAGYALAAFGFAAFAVGLWSMIPDVADHAARRRGHIVASTLVGVVSALQKAAIALGGLIVGQLLTTTQAPILDDAPFDGGTWFNLWSSLGPMFLAFVAACFFTLYPLDRARRA